MGQTWAHDDLKTRTGTPSESAAFHIQWSYGMEKLSICCSSCMQACYPESPQCSNNAFLSLPTLFRSSEPALEPMILDTERLSGTVRLHQLNQDLCLYCGIVRHFHAACHTQAQWSSVSACIPVEENMPSLTTNLTLTAPINTVPIQIGLFHNKKIDLLVLDGSTADIILGRPWLLRHNLGLSWGIG